MAANESDVCWCPVDRGSARYGLLKSNSSTSVNHSSPRCTGNIVRDYVVVKQSYFCGIDDRILQNFIEQFSRFFLCCPALWTCHRSEGPGFSSMRDFDANVTLHALVWWRRWWCFLATPTCFFRWCLHNITWPSLRYKLDISLFLLTQMSSSMRRCRTALVFLYSTSVNLVACFLN